MVWAFRYRSLYRIDVDTIYMVDNIPSTAGYCAEVLGHTQV